jgi:hypothetical protein
MVEGPMKAVLDITLNEIVQSRSGIIRFGEPQDFSGQARGRSDEPILENYGKIGKLSRVQAN